MYVEITPTCNSTYFFSAHVNPCAATVCASLITWLVRYRNVIYYLSADRAGPGCEGMLHSLCALTLAGRDIICRTLYGADLLFISRDVSAGHVGSALLGSISTGCFIVDAGRELIDVHLLNGWAVDMQRN